ncbi:MAG: TerB family tellurite resistance protein [Myxococcota bacterium]
MQIDWIDQLIASYPQLPLLDARLEGSADRDGYRYTFRFPEDYVGAVLILRAVDDDNGYHITFARGFEDDQGRFYCSQHITRSELSVFIPFGVVHPNRDGSLQLEATVIALPTDGQASLLGQGIFGCPWQQGTFQRMQFWRPLIGLCMALARASGALTRERVSVVRQQLTQRLQPDRNELQQLKAVMKQEPSAGIAALLRDHQVRAPDFDAGDLFGILAKIAHADNDISQEEVDTLKDIAVQLGANDERWNELRDYYGLMTRADALGEHLEVLKLEPHFTKKDIEKAFRKRLKLYHPDKYTHLPPEFQQVAHEMTQKLNDARQALLDSL